MPLIDGFFLCCLLGPQLGFVFFGKVRLRATIYDERVRIGRSLELEHAAQLGIAHQNLPYVATLILIGNSEAFCLDDPTGRIVAQFLQQVRGGTGLGVLDQWPNGLTQSRQLNTCA